MAIERIACATCFHVKPPTPALECAFHHGLIVITCNRDHFLRLARDRSHHGIVIVIRRRSRAAERAALLRLIERAGPAGLGGNINFA